MRAVLQRLRAWVRDVHSVRAHTLAPVDVRVYISDVEMRDIVEACVRTHPTQARP